MPVSIPNFLVPLLAEPVAVFGAGCSGRGAGALLQKLGARVVFFDEKRVGLGIVNNFDAVSARQHPLVVYSPGFAPDHPWFSVARAAGCECLSELDLAALHWRGKILAVTGTNGKTTLTEFLTHALTTRGVEARATGNIGYSFSQLVHDTDGGGGTEMMAVCEVSSFQAEGLRHFRADSTIWTNFAEDHLERHGSMAKYFAAKSNLLARTRNATIFVGESVQRFAKQMHRPLAENAVVFSEVKSPDHALNVSVFAHQPQHENYLLAAAWWEHAGYPAHELFSAARSFRLGRHRLNRVGEIAGVTWWNDSKATNFHAVEAALASFASPVMVILGGKGKGGDLGAFVKRIAPHVKRAFLLGETKAALAAFCAAYQVPYVVCSTLDETVTRAAKSARPSDQVLLSPGFSGFDLFRSYDDRGNQFENLVNNLGATATLG